MSRWRGKKPEIDLVFFVEPFVSIVLTSLIDFRSLDFFDTVIFSSLRSISGSGRFIETPQPTKIWC